MYENAPQFHSEIFLNMIINDNKKMSFADRYKIDASKMENHHRTAKNDAKQ